MANRRIGFLFALIAVLLVLLGPIRGGWYYAAIWPALSFVVAGSGYWKFGPRVYGKRLDGTLAWSRYPVLLPYFIYSWSVWHIFRLIKTENPYEELLPDVLIGRRLLPAELPEHVDRVLDLTAEFPEPAAIRRKVGYLCFPILDASAPSSRELVNLAKSLDRESGVLYIHCAEGHGRTGLVAAAVLLQRGIAESPAAAIARLKVVRPRVRLNTAQRTCLDSVAELLSQSTRTDNDPTDN